MKRHVVLGLIVVLLSGCGIGGAAAATGGQGYFLSRLQPGQFTKGDAISAWGAPNYEGWDAARKLRVLSWTRRQGGTRSVLAMWFDDRDRLVRWNVEPDWAEPDWGY